MSKMHFGKLDFINGTVFILALIFVLIVQGAIPFVATPTLGQAVWTTGFSQSFLNESVFSIYAQNIGAPKPAAMAFGLSGGWLTAVFLKLGLLAPDAYSAMIAVWMSIAFSSAYCIARYFKVTRLRATLAAVCWLTMPVTWAHASYSMLSTGIGLLPFYFFFSIKLFSPKAINEISHKSNNNKWYLLYPVICVISIFMDGYSFMMFAVGASILGAWMLRSNNGDGKKRLALISLPMHFLSLGTAYILYTLYIGKPVFTPSPIDFFRGWGVDLTFLLVPTKGVHWFPDLVGWSVLRSGKVFFGDASVWNTSFSIPLIIGSTWAAFKVFRKHKIGLGFILILSFGFYMSLGPSLKVNSVRPIGTELGGTMPEDYAISPTGSAFLSKNVPGLKNMRASYRWGALGVFGAWSLIVLALSTMNTRSTRDVAVLFVGVITILNLPYIPNKLKIDSINRDMFLAIDSDLVDKMRSAVIQGEKVAFVPWRNDFLINYVASRLDIVSFNIGGDKNFAEARKHWPKTMRSFKMATVDEDFSERVLLMLARHEVDVVVLPYIDTLWAAHRWPYPIQFKEILEPKVDQLASFGLVEITDSNFFAAIRLKPQFTHMDSEKLEKLNRQLICIPPYGLKQNGFSASTPTKVGIIQGGKIVSDGNPGFIHFGPYVPIEPGRYQLTIHGSGIPSASAWADVVSSKGTVHHAKFFLKSNINNNGLLAEGLVEIKSPVQDIEVRVYVSAEDIVTLESYELVAIDLNE